MFNSASDKLPSANRFTKLALLIVAPVILVDANFSLAEDHYGLGVHAYFRGQHYRAEHEFDIATGSDPADPRPYYFRALTKLRMGRGYEARDDMLIGASLEAQHPGRYLVGRSLQRVQGTDRLMLEKYRQCGRESQSIQREDYQLQRYEQEGLIHATKSPLRQRVVVPLEKLMNPISTVDFQVDTQPPASFTDERVNQFSPQGALSDSPTVLENSGSSQDSIDKANDPFADDPQQSSDKGPPITNPDGNVNPFDKDADSRESVDEDPFGDDPFGDF